VTVLPWVLIFVGGGAGATGRYVFGRFVGQRYGGAFPLGTFLINVSGCFALGLLATIIAGSAHAGSLNALLATGFLGGYTTFSTYALEGVVLFLDGGRRPAVVSLVAPIVLGLTAAGLGGLLGHNLRGA